MKVKTAILLFSTLCLVKTCRSDATDDANAALNKLRDNLNSLLYDAFTSGYTDMAQTADFTVQITKSNGTEVIVNDCKEFVAKYESIKKTAEDAGVDIRVCINEFEDMIKNLEPENVDGLVKCVDDQIDSTVDFISTCTVRLVQNNYKRVFDFEKSILACGDSETCLKPVTAEVLRINDAMVGYISYAVSSDKGNLQRYTSMIDVCGQRFTSTARGKGGAYIEGFQQCVDAQ